MSRQTDRADARNAAKVDKANSAAASRAATRKAKHLTPLSAEQAAGYPASRTVPHAVGGKPYKPNGKREVARRLVAAADKRDDERVARWKASPEINAFLVAA